MEITREDVISRLGMLGYTATEADYAHIDYEITFVTNYALNFCNVTELPEIVKPKLVDRICSQFLMIKKNSGLLEGFNYDAAIKSIKAGDTQVQYAIDSGGDTPENRFDAMVRELKNTTDKWLVPFRRLHW